MKKLLDSGGLLALIIVLALLAGGAYIYGSPLQLRSLLAGYLLFTLNYLALKGISGSLVGVAAGGRISRRAKLWLSIGSFCKFFGLLGTLYVLLVWFQLSGFFLAFGSLVSLLTLTGVQILTYIRRLKLDQSSERKI